MEAIGFGVSRDYHGNCYEIEYLEENYCGNEPSWLSIVAPYVEEGSYIEFVGEDGDIWRLVFKDGKCNTVSPQIKW